MQYISLSSVLFVGEMLEAGITAVGEFHYLHAFGNELGEELIEAAEREGIRITLLDACYLRGGMDGRPLDAVQKTFSDGDAEHWARRMDALEERQGVRIGAAIHSVRAVDPRSMQTVAAWARERNAPLHLHLAEQPVAQFQQVLVKLRPLGFDLRPGAGWRCVFRLRWQEAEDGGRRGRTVRLGSHRGPFLHMFLVGRHNDLKSQIRSHCSRQR